MLTKQLCESESLENSIWEWQLFPPLLSEIKNEHAYDDKKDCGKRYERGRCYRVQTPRGRVEVNRMGIEDDHF
jgi:hypothetical protein